MNKWHYNNRISNKSYGGSKSEKRAAAKENFKCFVATKRGKRR